MTLTSWGFGPTITAQKWSELFFKQAEGGAGEYVEGMKPTAAAGSRKVAIATGSAAVVGVLVENDAEVIVTLDESTTIRKDMIVLDLDWTTLTASIIAVKGGASVPTLAREAGTHWQIPLALVLVAPATAQLTNDDVIDQRPTRRQKQIYKPSIVTRTIGGAAGWNVVATQDVPYPGFDYRLDVSAALNMSHVSAGFGEIKLSTVADGTLRTSRASDQNEGLAYIPSHLTGKQTGISTVQLHMRPSTAVPNDEQLASYESYSYMQIVQEPF